MKILLTAGLVLWLCAVGFGTFYLKDYESTPGAKTSSHPADFSDDWVETDLWKDAALIPGVRVALDDEGLEADLFSAETSGVTLLYDSAGNLLFQGGITRSRGHEGDNDGRRSIVDFVAKDTARRAETFVYGCPLKNPQNCPQGIEPKK